jgi:hypothetical protein
MRVLQVDDDRGSCVRHRRSCAPRTIVGTSPARAAGFDGWQAKPADAPLVIAVPARRRRGLA